MQNDCFERDQTNMRSQDFVNELNKNSVAEGYGSVWAIDNNNINNGYPILKNTPYTIDDIINDPEDNTDREDENLDLTPAAHFYEDHNYNTQATNATIRIYANGGTVAVPGTTEKKNYKQCVLYTDILPSYIYTVGKNGAIKPSSGESVKVYLYPAYKQNGVVQKAKNVKYTAAVAANAADYFSVTQSGSNPHCFEISTKGLKGGKSVTGAITFTCNLNGKKAVFKATATNPVTNVSTINENGLIKKADNSFRIHASNTSKTSGTFELKPVCASHTDATTDKLKIYAMGSENGYDVAKLKEGKVQITAKKSSAQGKISMKAASNKKTVTVTVAKGTKPVTAYFLVVYNTVSDGAKKGYTVISVTAE